MLQLTLSYNHTSNKTANINAKSVVYHTSYRYNDTSKTAKLKKIVI